MYSVPGIRSLNERSALCREIAQKHQATGKAESAATWRRAADEAQKRELAVKTLVELGWVHPEMAEVS